MAKHRPRPSQRGKGNSSARDSTASNSESSAAQCVSNEEMQREDAVESTDTGGGHDEMDVAIHGQQEENVLEQCEGEGSDRRADEACGEADRVELEEKEVEGGKEGVVDEADCGEGEEEEGEGEEGSQGEEGNTEESEAESGEEESEEEGDEVDSVDGDHEEDFLKLTPLDDVEEVDLSPMMKECNLQNYSGMHISGAMTIRVW
eukprot:CAMPEP_0205902370 /NCGR_PEP_ID=MMETSP1083-20121108/28182_1 /ASSEMBLY_ACC=CAM_ASM_000430 /TAXON_ID=97485 /ORGANISM="Prymnesium parvum, Strain Texoma1" /LENGTH=203 /DNA_ID=CAMNT_0053267967 /DNA_START=298 /DNA_END=909 /DNA_ORIENTATION=-